VVHDEFCNKAEAFEAFDDIPTNPHLENTIGDLINRRFGRRDVLRGALGVTALTTLFGTTALVAADKAQAATSSRYHFTELESGVDDTHHVAEGYHADILLRWGDQVVADAREFDPREQTAQAQLKQFGYNNDFIGFVPLNQDHTRGLLCVNHEYTSEEVMFPGIGRQDKNGFADMTRALVEIEMAAHGGTVIEVARDANGKWAPVLDSKYNRRISALQTAMTLDGPAAGDDRMKTTEDPAGQQVIGTINNCAGGITPWGTYLMAEENFHGYFWTDKKNEAGKPILEGPEAKSWKRYGVPGGGYAWGKYFDRFNIDKEPNESNRFGWVVEVDPLNPSSTPVKHTALGRFRHEGAKSITNTDGRVVIYMGDDNSFDYLYKFVSDGKVSDDRAANLKLLSQGTLYVAKFNEDGTVDWMPLVHGQGPLTAANGFHSQADVLIDARLAADLLEATPMDRPEDVQPGLNGSVYFMLTNNTQRKPGQENAANPRAESAFGHIIEIVEPNRNYAATQSKWDILVLCGDPKVAEVGAKWNPATSEHGWFGSPDNCTVDADGRLWVSTDQGSAWPKTGKADGLYGLETQGAGRGTSKLFFRAPVGAELCSPCFTADNQTLFLSVQHPATDGVKSYPGFESDSTFEKPATRWPDFKAGMPPRPSVVVITKKGGGKIA
jgi:secreted PhoX family phosphatase